MNRYRYRSRNDIIYTNNPYQIIPTKNVFNIRSRNWFKFGIELRKLDWFSNAHFKFEICISLFYIDLEYFIINKK